MSIINGYNSHVSVALALVCPVITAVQTVLYSLFIVSQNTGGTLRDFPSPPEELLAAKSPVDRGTTASGDNSNSSTMRSRSDLSTFVSFAVFDEFVAAWCH